MKPDNVKNAGEGRVSQAGQRLLRLAEGMSAGTSGAEQPDPLSEFVQTYREWITLERGRAGTGQQQTEAWQLIFRSMMTGATLAEAIGLLIRFGKVVWGGRGPAELRREDGAAILVFHEPFRVGPEGLIAALWPLALTLCELEFLAATKIRGASGRVMHEPCLPDGLAHLLFGPPIAFGQAEVALVLPATCLARPVVAQPGDLEQFFAQLLPLTLGAGRAPARIAAMVAGLIREDKRGETPRGTSLENVAARLGMSAPTLRRRLKEEGTGFRQVREGVYNALAHEWLRRGERPVSAIAARLGFSDDFAFRRFFHRLNGFAPSALRAGGRQAGGD